jgi:hypothetical protein
VHWGAPVAFTAPERSRARATFADAEEGGEGEGDEDEDEDEDQQHYPGRMRTAADARQHVVYPNPTLSIAARPTSGRLRGTDIVTKHGATNLISALHIYLGKHGTRKLPPQLLSYSVRRIPRLASPLPPPRNFAI